jgi:hypothetical protein
MTKKLSIWKGVSVAIFAAFLSSAAMAEQMPDKGVLHMTRVKQEAIPSPFNNGETLTLSQSTGEFEAADEKNPLNGADIVNVDFSDVTNGNGTVQIWSALNKDGSVSYTKAITNIKTSNGADGKPVTTATTTYEKIGGTGKFAKLKGSGTATRKIISPNTYDVEITGNMELP